MYKCKYCGGETWKNGVVKGVQRFRCKVCWKFSSDSQPKYSKEDRENAIKFYLNNCGVRKTALFVGCSPGTILNWIRDASNNLKEEIHAVDGDTVEMDEIFAQADRRIATVNKKKEAT